jgi:hypothetical protein
MGLKLLSAAALAALAFGLVAEARLAPGAAAPVAISTLAAGAPVPARAVPFNPDRAAYFGDLHVHTRLSFDAYIFNVRASPDDAYRYARGESIGHALGYDVRLTDAPLDFLAVTDHAEYLGVLQAMNDANDPLSQIPYAPELFSRNPAKITAAFQRVGNSLRDGVYLEEMRAPATRAAAWASVVDAAERNYQPGVLTTFIGYEYTSAPGGRNLHRNVIFRGSRAPELPFSALESQNPEQLWSWMDAQRARGMEVLAIPHNSNGSDGAMFARTDWAGGPIDAAYAAKRMRNEPLVEITQVKGTSETHPSLSPNDEWANFEIMPTYIGSTTMVTVFDGGYVRRALEQGLLFEETMGANPYEFGFVGASDTHNAGGPIEENHFFGKGGVTDGSPERRGSIPPGGAQTWEGYEPTAAVARFGSWGAAGLTGVWAEQNTRDSIFAALRRKETFATTGPRIRVRFFASYDYPADILDRADLVREAYRRGAAMGSALVTRSRGAPSFLVWALRDSHAGWLQRAQVIKGWVKDGETHEQVFDVACADGLSVDPQTHRCPDNGASVDPATCEVSRNRGGVELRTLWRDPTYDPSLRAFYYVRVLENPTCRWSTWDALRNGTPPNPNLPLFIQERAWTSPIWFAPRT